MLSIDCSPPNKKRTGDSFRCKHEVRPSKLNYFYVVIVLGYAPELNPDEGVWNHLKKTLANGRPDAKNELMDVLSDEICRMAASQTL